MNEVERIMQWQKRKDLLYLLDKNTINKLEAKELREILVMELNDCIKQEDFLKIIAIVAVLQCLAFKLSRID